MNEDTEKVRADEPDDIDNILALSSARPVPRKEIRDRAFSRLQRDWMSGIRRRRRMHRFYALGAAASLAAIVAVTVQIGTTPMLNDTSVAAELLKVSGQNVRINGHDVLLPRQGEPSRFTTGDTITTGSESKIALSWQSTGSLRLNAQTEIAFLSPQSVRLNYGTLYFDSDPADLPGSRPAKISIDTPHGTVRHLGTQFMTEVSPARIAISVREGAVHFEDAQQSFSIPAGDSVEVRADDSVRHQPVSPTDGQWHWATQVAPEMEFNGRSTLDLLTWIARETGRELRFESSTARNLAASDRLVGLDRVGPLQALEYVPLISDLRYEIDGAVIRIGTRSISAR